MRLLNKYDLLELFNTGYGMHRPTMVFETLEYHGKDFPLEFTVEKIVSEDAQRLKRVVEQTAFGDVPSIPKISMTSTTVKELYIQPVGVCQQSDIEQTLSAIGQQKQSAEINPNLGVLRLALNEMTAFKKDIERAEAAERQHRIQNSELVPLLT